MLRSISLFADMSDDEISDLVAIGDLVSVPAGRVMFERGAPGDAMYVLLSGRVRVSCVVDESDVEMTVLAPGDYLGEVAVLGGGTRTARARAVVDSELFEICREPFMTLLTTSPHAMSSVLGRLSQHIRSGVDRYSLALAQQALERSRSEVERHRSISLMVAGVAHELNTPIGIIAQAAGVIAELLGSDTSETLARDDAARAVLQDVDEAVSLIARSAGRASELVLAFKNLSSREARGVPETVDLAAVMAEAVELYAGRARASGLKLEVVDRRADPSKLWTGQAGALEQVLLNLLTNVGRYAYPDAGGGTAWIELDDEVRGAVAGIAVTVRDAGAGIAPEHVGEVFEPFFTTGRGRGGTGLGLSIVRNLVTGAIGGSVSIESELGRGTAVHVWIPRDT